MTPMAAYDVVTWVARWQGSALCGGEGGVRLPAAVLDQQARDET